MVLQFLRNFSDSNNLQDDIEKRIEQHFGLSKKNISDIEINLGKSPCQQQGDFEISSNQLDEILVQFFDSACEYKFRKRHSSGAKMGCEGPLEELSSRFGVHPNKVYEKIVRDMPNLKGVLKTYCEDQLHKIALTQMGFESINQINIQPILVDKLGEKIRAKVPTFETTLRSMLNFSSFEEWAYQKLPSVHSDSFLTEPIFQLTEGGLIEPLDLTE